MVRYEVVGDDAAPALFRVRPEEGQITVAADLKQSSALTYTVRSLTHPHRAASLVVSLCA